MEAKEGGSDGVADFDATFREHYESMVRGLGLACGDREVAADAVQDAFMRAYARWGRISRYDDPAGWVRHVALNRLRDHFRSATRGQRAVERLASRGDANPVPPPEPPSDVNVLLDSLPHQQRIAAALYYVEQLSVREVAEAMGLSEGAVKYHLHAGRATLREHLEKS
jgi:RNA polymerase sigma-70 factor (ECF subfamily)